MNNPFHIVAIALIFVAYGYALARPAVSALPEGCIGDWAEAAVIVKDRNMVDVASLSRMVAQRLDAQILTARLCKVDDRYIYRLIIRNENGRTKHMTLDADRVDEK